MRETVVRLGLLGDALLLRVRLSKLAILSAHAVLAPALRTGGDEPKERERGEMGVGRLGINTEGHLLCSRHE